MSRMPRLPAILVLPLAVAGCHLTSVEAVQAVAGTDFSCPEDKVKVTPAQEKDTFVAAGCGKKGTFVCEGWDSYNQKPICSQR
jgi:hypothetical protein